jgi:tetratricopeptide (TPR) repeat protein
MGRKMKKSVMRNVSRWGAISLVLVIVGCASAPPKPTPEKPSEKSAEKPSLPSSPQRYLDLAMHYEKSGELPRALLCWQVVQTFQPTDGEVAGKIAELKARMLALAEQHFKRGQAYYKSNAVPAARREFAFTLYYDPEHSEALAYLKNRLNEEDYTLYEVKSGDTLREIARKIYNDPQKDFLVAYFNDLGKDPKLAPKMVLMLPILEISQPKGTPDAKELMMDPKELLAEPRESKETKETQETKETKEAKEAKETREMMAKAEINFKANKFKETVSITEDILSIDPNNKQARGLTNASYYQMGKTLSAQKKYEEALGRWSRVDPGFRDVSELIVSTKRQLAEVHYVNGIKYYTEEKLDKAVQEWEETLALNPQHPKAKGDIESALKLLQKLKDIK